MCKLYLTALSRTKTMSYLSIFKNKVVDFKKLLQFGFIKEGNIYHYQSNIADGEFILTIKISKDNKINVKVIDPDFDEEYTLHLTDACGPYIGKIRTDIENILTKIANNCFETKVFKSVSANKIISYIHKKYQSHFEYLWEKFPSNAIVRRQDNRKWYGVLMAINQKKLGLSSDGMVEVINLRMLPEKIRALQDYKKYFPGFHMNKKHWITIILNGSVPLEEIFARIDESYLLAKNRKNKV